MCMQQKHIVCLARVFAPRIVAVCKGDACVEMKACDFVRQPHRLLSRERERDRDRGILSQFEQMRIRNGECITLEVPQFRYWDSVQVVPPGRYPMTKELVLALANAHIKEYTLELNNRNDPHFTIDENHNRFVHSVRNVVPAGMENRQRAPPRRRGAPGSPPRRGDPGYDSDDLYS